ncbi:callose synthase 5 [Quercus suber]|uniref:Callose synthase 5 n=1 Tax=Quercus suber TaxID=58331 RepID=A0AAW0L461_QUESU
MARKFTIQYWSRQLAMLTSSTESFGPIVIVYFANILLDNYLEEALKMRNLLEEFKKDHGVCLHTILGVKEHIFTEMVQFHYGHPNVFDRIFCITHGGISKASMGINLREDISKDIYAGIIMELLCCMDS